MLKSLAGTGTGTGSGNGTGTLVAEIEGAGGVINISEVGGGGGGKLTAGAALLLLMLFCRVAVDTIGGPKEMTAPCGNEFPPRTVGANGPLLLTILWPGMAKLLLTVLPSGMFGPKLLLVMVWPVKQIIFK